MNEILLYGTVGEAFWGEESFTAKQVREQLSALQGDLTVRINSGGGSATDGAAIYAALSGYPSKVTVVIEGVAASAASLIAMAGDEIVMAEGAWILIHDPAVPFADGRGTSADHDRTSQMLEVIAREYAGIYARRTGNSVAEVRRLMIAETVMTGEAAIQMGFATRIEAALQAKAAARFDYRIYANAPQGLREASERFGREPSKEAIMAMWAGIPAKEKASMNVRVTPPGKGDDESAGKIVMSARDLARIHMSGKIAGMTVDQVNALAEAGMTATQALDAITAHWKEAGDVDAPMFGEPTARIGRDSSDPKAIAARMSDAIAAKIGARMGVKYEPTSGREFADLSIAEMNAALLRSHGHKVSNPAHAIMSSLSTSDFPMAVGQGLTSIVRLMAEQAPVAIERCARTIEADDYRTGNAISLSGTSVPEPVNSDGGEIKFGNVNEEGEVKAVPGDYGQILRITKQALVNDSTATSLLSDLAREQVRGARELKRRVLLAPLLANSGLGQTMRDSQPLFHSSHGNLAAAGAAISVASLSAARTAMLRQRDSNGIILAPEPTYLVVPPELQTVAEQTVAAITANTPATVNPFSGRLEVIAEPGLTNLTAWYVVADPTAFDGLVMAYLSGEEGPRIEAKEGWETLGMEFRLVWAIGSAFHGFQSWYRNPGA